MNPNEIESLSLQSINFSTASKMSQWVRWEDVQRLEKQVEELKEQNEKYLTRIQMVEEYKINDSLRQQLTQLEQDKRRLDWLNDTAFKGGNKEWILALYEFDEHNFRTAIDNAIKVEGEKV